MARRVANDADDLSEVVDALADGGIAGHFASGRHQPLVAARVAADEAVTRSGSAGSETGDETGIVDAAAAGSDVDLEPVQEG